MKMMSQTAMKAKAAARAWAVLRAPSRQPA